MSRRPFLPLTSRGGRKLYWSPSGYRTDLAGSRRKPTTDFSLNLRSSAGGDEKFLTHDLLEHELGHAIITLPPSLFRADCESFQESEEPRSDRTKKLTASIRLE